MVSKNRSSEDKNFQLMRDRFDKSDALSNSAVLKRVNVRQRTGTKACSSKYVTMNKCCSFSIVQRQLHVDRRRFQSLIEDLHTQLDDKWIQDNEDHLWRQKYREQAKVYMLDLYEVGCAEFTIDPSDLHGTTKSVLYELDPKSAEYVLREVLNKIFGSIGVLDFKLRLRDIVCYSLGES